MTDTTRSVLLAAVLVLGTMTAALSPRAARYLDPRLQPTSTAEEVAAAYGPTSDTTHYIRAGRDLAALEPIHARYTNYWTAGMPVLIATVMLVSGEDAYPLKLAWVSALLWSVALVVAAAWLQPRGRALVAACCALAVWLLPDFGGWTFGVGSLLSDGPAAAMLLAGTAATLAALATPRTRLFVAAGLLLGAAANLRYASLMLCRPVLVAMLVAVVVLMRRRGMRWRAIVDALRGREPPGTEPGAGTNINADAGTAASTDADADAGVDADEAMRWLRRSARGMIVLLAVFFTSLVPWSAYKLATSHTARWYTASASLKYGRMWLPDDQQAPWAHGANAQCHADPELCAEVQRGGRAPREFFRLAVATTLAHPLAVAEVKLGAFPWLWCGKSWEQLRSSWESLVEGAFLLVLGLVGCGLFVASAVRTRHPAALVAATGLAVLLVHQTALFTFLHYEWRFSASLRALCAVGVWWAAGFAHRLRAAPDA